MALSLPGSPWACQHCGTVVRPATPVDLRVVGAGAQQCPLCRCALDKAVMNDRTPVQTCPRCHGLLMPRREFVVTLVAQRAAAKSPAITPSAADPAQLDRRIECPQCGGRMVTDWYYGPGGIVVDTCTSCDTIWLDAGELQRAIDAPGPDRPA